MPIGGHGAAPKLTASRSLPCKPETLKVETTLIDIGAACVIAAIVGGGLKAFGLELPQLISRKRQLVLAIFGAMIAAIGYAQWRAIQPSPGFPLLAGTTWTLKSAIDNQGANWSNSTLEFVRQTDERDGLSLRGTFTWRRNNELVGIEEFDGHYVHRVRTILFQGTSVKNASSSEYQLAPGSYSVTVSVDERELVDGRWNSTNAGEQGVPGRWEAIR